MKVLFASAECAPFFKTGGLGDVAEALPKSLAQQGVDIRVVLPFYTHIPERYREKIVDLTHFYFKLGEKTVYCGIKTLSMDGVTYYFIDNLSYFDRGVLYGEWDDGERFGFFSTALIEMLEVIDWIPNIIHCNDWHTAMVPALLVDRYHWNEKLRTIRKVFTIHNLKFQGVYNPSILSHVFSMGYNTYTQDGVMWHQRVNFMKGGINFSDRVTTVSPTYAAEIQTPEFGEQLEGVLSYNQWKLRGILNGIDPVQNNPETDSHLVCHFNQEDLSGKYESKEMLQREVGLPVDRHVALIGVVTRLTEQKGIQLLEERLEELLSQAHVQIVVLGTGEERFEQSLCYFQERYPHKMRSIIDFNVGLAQRIYAGSDMFLMPSAFEPCGLSQLIAMRYGTLPIVHETGGLKDTVRAYNRFTKEGTGFSFNGYNSWNLLSTIYRALTVYYQEPEDWQKLIQQAMQQDFSWEKPTQQYVQLYQELLDE